MIKFIYFDLGNVIFSYEKVFLHVAEEFNKKVQDFFKLHSKYQEPIMKGFITPQEFWVNCQKELNITNGDNFNFLESWLSGFKPSIKVHNLLRKLENKYEIGILSNIYKNMWQLLLKKQIIPRINYKAIILSCDIGLMKPEMQIYEEAQKKAKAKAKEILFIDDKKEFLKAAKTLDWQCLLFDIKNINDNIDRIERIIRK